MSQIDDDNNAREEGGQTANEGSRYVQSLIDEVLKPAHEQIDEDMGKVLEEKIVEKIDEVEDEKQEHLGEGSSSRARGGGAYVVLSTPAPRKRKLSEVEIVEEVDAAEFITPLVQDMCKTAKGVACVLETVNIGKISFARILRQIPLAVEARVIAEAVLRLHRNSNQAHRNFTGLLSYLVSRRDDDTKLDFFPRSE